MLSPVEDRIQWFLIHHRLHHKTAGIPQIHYFGQEGSYNALVIDPLGPNLSDLLDMCGGKFSVKTVCMAAKQIVRTTLVFSVSAPPLPAQSTHVTCLNSPSPPAYF